MKRAPLSQKRTQKNVSAQERGSGQEAECPPFPVRLGLVSDGVGDLPGSVPASSVSRGTERGAKGPATDPAAPHSPLAAPHSPPAPGAASGGAAARLAPDPRLHGVHGVSPATEGQTASASLPAAPGVRMGRPAAGSKRGQRRERRGMGRKRGKRQ